MLPYEVAVDERRHTLHATLRGFWDVATARAYLVEMTAAARRVSRDGAASWWLIDLSDSAVQTREVSEVMGERLPGIIPAGATLAVVVAGSLRAMQSRRVVTSSAHGYFPTVAVAEAWLTAQGQPA